jgi:hypothetical protein
MGNDLGFLAQLVSDRATGLLHALQRKTRGRGSTLVAVLQPVCEDLRRQAEQANATPPASPREEEVRLRTLLRADQQLDVLYEVVSHFRDDVARQDLPVGLLYLIDELIRDLLPNEADPLIHLDNRHMYSTLPILETLPGLLQASSVPHPHPVAFNLPRLDPGNALFAPILAHEVGHTAWRQGVGTTLDTLINDQDVKPILDTAVAAGVGAKELAAMYNSWRQELMCDALAATLTGPSFLFAASVFLPAPANSALGTHPYPRDRIGLALRILERFDWTDTLERLVPDALSWCKDVAADPKLTSHPAESALRAAMTAIEPTVLELAESHCVKRLRATDFTARESQLFSHFELEVPPVSILDGAESPWMVIGAAWLSEIRAHQQAVGPASLPSIAANSRLNRFILKTIELSAVADFWGADEPSAS